MAFYEKELSGLDFLIDQDGHPFVESGQLLKSGRLISSLTIIQGLNEIKSTQYMSQQLVNYGSVSPRDGWFA